MRFRSVAKFVDECRPRAPTCMLGGRYGWVPPGKTRSLTADEVAIYGVLDRDLTSRGFALPSICRDPSATAAMVEAAHGRVSASLPGSRGADALAKLKTAIIEAGSPARLSTGPQWDGPSRTADRTEGVWRPGLRGSQAEH